MRMTLCLALRAAWLTSAGAHPNPHRTTSAYRSAGDSTELAPRMRPVPSRSTSSP